MKKTLILGLLMISELAIASSQTGTVEKMIVGRLGYQVYVHLSNASTCSSEHPLGYNFAFSLNDHDAGKEILSTLLAAQMAQRQVTVQGMSQCTIDDRMEDISYVTIYK